VNAQIHSKLSFVSHAAQQPIIDVVELGIVALWTLLSSFLKSMSRTITIRRTTLELLQCCSSTCEQNVSSMETWKTANMVRGCSRSETYVCKPQVHLTETTLGEGRGDHQELHAPSSSVSFVGFGIGPDDMDEGRAGRRRAGCWVVWRRCTVVGRSATKSAEPMHVDFYEYRAG